MEDVRLKVNALLDKIADNTEKSLSLDAYLSAGDTKLLHSVVTEAIFLDEKWIETIEAALFSVEQIVKNPQKSIIDEQILVNVEKARKINARSIQYLASHSEHVSNFVDGEVRPSKIMTTEFEEDYKTYENRFVYSLILRLEKFVSSRYEDVKGKLDTHRTDVIEYRNTVKTKRAEMDCEMKLVVRDVPRGSVELEKNYELLRRIETLQKRIRILKAGNFFDILSGTKPVLPPIIKTNLLQKNVDYSNAYQLWLYISAYTFEGFRLEVERKMLPFDDEYAKDLTDMAALLWNVTEANNEIRRSVFEKLPASVKKSKKYKVLTRYDYQPTFQRSSGDTGEDVVNQYYFDEMKKLVGKTTETLKGNVLIEKQSFSAPFSKFFRSMNRISNSIYDEVLIVSEEKKTKKKKTRVDLLKAKVKRQTEVLKRKKLLSKLKAEELTKTLNAESKELVKLEKLKFELALAEEKKIAKKTANDKKKVRLQAVRKKSEAALRLAESTRKELLSEEEQRQRALLEERRLKFEQLREAKERRTYERLKAKYEKETDDEE